MRPDRPAIKVIRGVEDGDAPFRGVFEDRPIQGVRPSVAGRAGMNDQAADLGQNAGGNLAAQIGRDHHIGAKGGDRGQRIAFMHVERDGQRMTILAQVHMQALGQ